MNVIFLTKFSNNHGSFSNHLIGDAGEQERKKEETNKCERRICQTRENKGNRCIVVSPSCHPLFSLINLQNDFYMVKK